MLRQGVLGSTAASDDGACSGETRQRRGRRQVSTPKSRPASVEGRFERAERASAATTSALLRAAAKRWVQPPVMPHPVELACWVLSQSALYAVLHVIGWNISACV